MRGRFRLRLFATTCLLVSASSYAVLALIGRASLDGTTVLIAILNGIVVAAVTTELALRWLDEGVRPLTDAARRMHTGDLTVRARVPREEDVGQLGAALDELATSLSRTVGELRSQRDLVSRILDGMQEGVLLLDHEGRVALMNPALREMLLLRADFIGQPLLEVVRHAELKELLDRARTTRATCSGEIELGGLKPRRLLVRGTSFTRLGQPATQVTDAQDGATKRDRTGGLLAVFFDVTDIRRLESLRRDFVANVSHELRTPVTAILSAAETMETALARDPEHAKRFLAIIERNAARLQRLIEDLLDLSRIESRELRLRKERFAFEPFATHVVGMFRERADKRSIALRVDVTKDLATIADRRALEQVLTNLVDNAVKYASEGCSVTVRASTSEPSSTSAPRLVRILVEDDGPGIEQAHLARLFERFYRVDAGRSREMGGTGLGLSIAKHLVEAMGGTIDVRSAIGKGTTFEIAIPSESTQRREELSSEDAA